MRLRWSERARQDLLAIGRYIGREDRAAARRWVDQLRERARAAADAPLAGRRVPEVGRDDIREVLLKSYRIVYAVREGEIRVLTVFEGHRLLRDDVEGEAR